MDPATVQVKTYNDSAAVPVTAEQHSQQYVGAFYQESTRIESDSLQYLTAYDEHVPSHSPSNAYMQLSGASSNHWVVHQPLPANIPESSCFVYSSELHKDVDSPMDSIMMIADQFLVQENSVPCTTQASSQCAAFFPSFEPGVYTPSTPHPDVVTRHQIPQLYLDIPKHTVNTIQQHSAESSVEDTPLTMTNSCSLEPSPTLHTPASSSAYKSNNVVHSSIAPHHTILSLTGQMSEELTGGTSEVDGTWCISSFSPYDQAIGSSRPPDAGLSACLPKPEVATPALREVTLRRRRAYRNLFNCQYCSGSFTAKHNLNNHLNSHFGIKRFQCDRCPRAFGTRHVLNRHRKTCKGTPTKL